MDKPLRCNHQDDRCKGSVEMWIRPWDWKTFPYCELHMDLRIQEDERINREYGV